MKLLLFIATVTAAVLALATPATSASPSTMTSSGGFRFWDAVRAEREWSWFPRDTAEFASRLGEAAAKTADATAFAQAWTRAKAVYESGGSAPRSSPTRTLQSLSTTAESRDTRTTSVFKAYETYFGTPRFGDRLVSDALNGAQAFSTTPVSTRARVAALAPVTTTAFAEVLARVDLAVARCTSGNADAALAEWDAAWALYADVGNATSDASLYAIASEACALFRTCDETGQRAKASNNVLEAFALGQVHVVTGRCGALQAAATAVSRNMVVPLVQMTLAYAHRADVRSSFATRSADNGVERGSLWAFSHALLPLMSSRCGASVAARVRSNTDVSESPPVREGVTTFVRAVQQTYGCLGISCADVGEHAPDAPRCVDASAATFAPSVATPEGINCPKPSAEQAALINLGVGGLVVVLLVVAVVLFAAGFASGWACLNRRVRLEHEEMAPGAQWHASSNSSLSKPNTLDTLSTGGRTSPRRVEHSPDVVHGAGAARDGAVSAV